MESKKITFIKATEFTTVLRLWKTPAFFFNYYLLRYYFKDATHPFLLHFNLVHTKVPSARFALVESGEPPLNPVFCCISTLFAPKYCLRTSQVTMGFGGRIFVLHPVRRTWVRRGVETEIEKDFNKLEENGVFQPQCLTKSAQSINEAQTNYKNILFDLTQRPRHA